MMMGWKERTGGAKEAARGRRDIYCSAVSLLLTSLSHVFGLSQRINPPNKREQKPDIDFL